MSSSIAQNIEALCQEQGIERDLVIEAMKEAVRAAAKKQFKSGEDIQVDWNAETGIELSASKVVVDEVENPATELSIDEARELAGDEVELGDALLLPLPIECYFCAMPPQRDVLLVTMREGETASLYNEPVLIRGTLKLQRGPGVKFFYGLENATFEAAEDGGALTKKRPQLQHMVPSHERDDSQLLPGWSEPQRDTTD